MSRFLVIEYRLDRLGNLSSILANKLFQRQTTLPPPVIQAFVIHNPLSAFFIIHGVNPFNGNRNNLCVVRQSGQIYRLG